jgi:hypothetical protein
MIKKTDKSATGTSYHMIDVKTTLRKLIDTFGEPQSICNDGSDKTNINYVLENSDGMIFTIYDWKMYRPIDMDEVLHFHIGAYNVHNAFEAKNEMHGLGLFVG